MPDYYKLLTESAKVPETPTQEMYPGQESGPIQRLGTIPKAIVQGALPTLGAVGGGAIGMAAIPALGPAGAMAGGSAGAMLGEMVNQYLGITAPSQRQIGIQGLADPVTRGVMGAAKFAGRMLPGSTIPMQEEAVKKLRSVPEMLAPEEASKPIFQALRGRNPNIRTTKLNDALDRMIAEAKAPTEGLRDDNLISMLQSVKDKAGKGALPFQEFDADYRLFGTATGVVKGQPMNQYRGRFNVLRDAMYEDLEAAATSTGTASAESQMLLKAHKLYRQEESAKEIAELIQSKGVSTQPTTGLESVKPGQLQRELDYGKRSRFIKESFTPEQWNEAQGIINSVKFLPQLPPPAGLNVGSALRLTGFVGVGSAGYLAGGAEGAAIANLALAGAHKGFGMLLQTERGRQFLRKVIDSSGGYLDWPKMAAISNFAVAQTAQGGGTLGQNYTRTAPAPPEQPSGLGMTAGPN